MNKPTVNIIQPQHTSTTTDIDINSAEARALLAKYNFKQPSQPAPIYDPNKGLSFEEMVAQEEIKIKADKQKRLEELNRPRAVTFNDRNVNYHDTSYKNLEEGFGIQIQIVTDMNIDAGYNPKYYLGK